MSELPVLKPIEPIAKCGACDSFLYPHSTACLSSRTDCPLLSNEWMHIRRMRDMQNTYLGPPVNLTKQDFNV